MAKVIGLTRAKRVKPAAKSKPKSPQGKTGQNQEKTQRPVAPFSAALLVYFSPALDSFSNNLAPRLPATFQSPAIVAG